MRKAAALAPLALSACAAAAAGEPPVRGASEQVCKADGLGAFVGKAASQQLGADMLRVSGARTLQWIEHGMMVTMDFRADRLRVYLTTDNKIERASCG